MKNTMPLQTVFSGHVFDIPDYQRGYAWETQQVDEFWEDLQSLHPKRLHYAGTIALFESDAAPTTMDNEGNHYTRSEVVDGQQRLTTVVILLNEIAKALRSLDEHDTLAQGITKNFVRATGMHGLPLYKLNLNQETDQFFKDHVLPDVPQDIAGPLVASSTRLLNARERLALHLIQGPEDHAELKSWLTSLYEKITSSLRFNRFEIEDPTDVGVIFEVVNDRGKSLSDLEKVKNFLLYTASRLGIDEVSKKQFADAVNDTWKAILTNLSQADLESAANENQLLRAHWIMDYDPQTHNWRGAKSIKERLDPGHMDTGEALQQLFDYLSSLRNSCVAYCDFLKPNRTDAFNIFPTNSRGEVKAWNQRLARIGVTATFLPLFIGIRKRWPEDPAPYLETLRLCEAVAFRTYRISRYAAHYRQPAMFRLANKVSQADSVQDILPEIKRHYDSRDARREFAQFSDHDVLHNWFGRSGLSYLLYEYETHLAAAQRGLPITPWGHINNSSIEHILPQSIEGQDYWIERFDEQTHRDYVHDIGNLSLTNGNESLSNKPFPQKRDCDNAGPYCYRHSNLKIENEIAEAWSDWTVDTIVERRRRILRWATKRWHVDFDEPDQPSYDPDDDPDETMEPELTNPATPS